MKPRTVTEVLEDLADFGAVPESKVWSSSQTTYSCPCMRAKNPVDPAEVSMLHLVAYCHDLSQVVQASIVLLP